VAAGVRVLEPPAPNADSEIDAAKVILKGVNNGLNSFLLKPPGIKGEELFAHMISKRQISPTRPKTMSPSRYLGIEISDSNRAVLAMDDKTILTKLSR